MLCFDLINQQSFHTFIFGTQNRLFPMLQALSPVDGRILPAVGRRGSSTLPAWRLCHWLASHGHTTHILPLSSPAADAWPVTMIAHNSGGRLRLFKDQIPVGYYNLKGEGTVSISFPKMTLAVPEYFIKDLLAFCSRAFGFH